MSSVFARMNKFMAEQKKPPAPTKPAPRAAQKAAPKVSMKQKRKLSTQALHRSLALFSTLSRAGQRLAAMTAQHRNFAEFRRLGTVIQENGITPSLMQFVDPHQILASKIKDMPPIASLEAFGLSAKDRRVRDTLVGLRAALESEAEIVASWVLTTTADIEDMAEMLQTQTEEFGYVIGNLQEAISNGEGTANVEATLTAVKADRLIELVNALTDVARNIEVPDYSLDQTEELKESFITLLKPLADKLGLTYIDGVVGFSADSVNDEYKPKTGTLAELGYSPESVLSLLTAVSGLIGTLKAICEKRGQIVERLRAAETAVKTASTTELEGDAGDATAAAENARLDDDAVIPGVPPAIDPITAPNAPVPETSPDYVPDGDPAMRQKAKMEGSIDPDVKTDHEGDVDVADAHAEGDQIDNANAEPPAEERDDAGEAAFEELAEGDDPAVSALDQHRHLLGSWVGTLLIVVQASMTAIASAIAVGDAILTAPDGTDVLEDGGGAATDETGEAEAGASDDLGNADDTGGEDGGEGEGDAADLSGDEGAEDDTDPSEDEVNAEPGDEGDLTPEEGEESEDFDPDAIDPDGIDEDGGEEEESEDEAGEEEDEDGKKDEE